MATRYHIDVNGNPAACKASKKPCPRGDESEHFPTADEARKAFEDNNTVKFASFRKENPWESLSIEEFANLEEQTLQDHLESGEPYTDEEYDRHREYIRQVMKGRKSTHAEHTSKVKGKTVYSVAREALHNEIISEIVEGYNDVPKEGKVLLTGGLPGSGKTTVIHHDSSINADSYASINPDDIKEILARRGMAPQIKGLLPMETNSLLQFEAQHISDRLLDELSEAKTNILLDKTMASPNPLSRSLKELKEKGYSEIDGVFVDVNTTVAYDRIVARHRQGLDDFVVKKEGIGGRPVSGKVVFGSLTDNPNYNSKNAETLIKLDNRKEFTRTPKVFDTSEGSPVEIPFDEFNKG